MREPLHRGGCPAVRIPFPENRIDRAAQNFRITVFDRNFLLVLWIFRIIWKGITLILKFTDGRLQLRNRSTDVGKFDDVRFWRLGQFPKFRQMVRHLLFRRQLVRKRGKDPCRKGDVSGFQLDPRTAGEGLDDWK